MKWIIQKTRWFCKMSVGYVLGNWEVSDPKERILYVLNFPRAYVRFIWFSWRSA